jgi:hypothetical protein
LAEAHAKQQAEVEQKRTAMDSSTVEQQSTNGTADASTMQSSDVNNNTAAAATGDAERQQALTDAPDTDADGAGVF